MHILKNTIKASLVLLAALTLITSPSLMAANFKLDKTRIVFDEETRRDEIKIYNESNILQSYKVSIIEMEMTEEGSLVEIESSQSSAAPFLRVGPRVSRDVKPYTFQKVRIIKKKSPKPGEYRSHLVVEALAKEPVKQVSGVFIRPNIKYVIPIIIRQGVEKAELEFGTPNTTDDGMLELVLNRKGNTSINGNIVVTDKNDEEIYRANQVSVYQELVSRKLKTDLKKEDMAGQTLSLLFEDPNNEDEVLVRQVVKM